ncbi:MAG: hypothetical protein RRY07_10665, partial [Bacteroidaceae bacterium]
YKGTTPLVRVSFRTEEEACTSLLFCSGTNEVRTNAPRSPFGPIYLTSQSHDRCKDKDRP